MNLKTKAKTVQALCLVVGIAFIIICFTLTNVSIYFTENKTDYHCDIKYTTTTTCSFSGYTKEFEFTTWCQSTNFCDILSNTRYWAGTMLGFAIIAIILSLIRMFDVKNLASNNKLLFFIIIIILLAFNAVVSFYLPTATLSSKPDGYTVCFTPAFLEYLNSGLFVCAAVAELVLKLKTGKSGGGLLD